MNLRLLRDNAALTRLAYVEWDLQAIFDADLYPEFLLLWLVCHQSRFEGEKPESCLLEQWKRVAQEKGLRALENLRPGVEKAITSLGEGLVAHKSNRELRRKLSSGELSTQKFYWQVLRVVYRMLFLYVAEDRELLHVPTQENATPDEEKNLRVARERYLNYYSITRLRSLSLSRAGTPHPDLWHTFALVCGILGSDKGSPELALPALGSFLWTEEESTPDLKDCLVSNRHFLEAVHAIAFVQDGNVRRAVDYRNLGAEELGSVYESLLELHPLVNADTVTFELKTAAGHERKTTGSYYTPDSLVQCLLDSALEPVMTEAVKGKKAQEAVEAILKLKICDPAVGSGHFLIAAAHRMAKKVAALRTEEDEPAPSAVRIALRDVIGHCLYGVDLNPMAAELCRVNLWLEALVPGKPLTFLDHHIQVGNSLLGATPELISKGIPYDAFNAIEGDDKKACAVLKKRNREERKSIAIEHANQAEIIHERLCKSSLTLDAISDESLVDIRNKEIAYRKMKTSDEHKLTLLLSDTWCASFVLRKVFQNPSDTKSVSGITLRHLDEIASGGSLPKDVLHEVHNLAIQYRFFHWHLAFPEVFERGGFDCVLGNPPWEHAELKEKEWFAECRPDIANASTGAERKRMIEVLKHEDPTLFASFTNAQREHDGVSHFIGDSGRYPLCGRGRINLYAVFAEAMRTLLNVHGRTGCVLPTGIATDDTTKFFFRDVVEKKSLVSLYSFENEEFIFPNIHHATKFCLFTTGRGTTAIADRVHLVFSARQVDHLWDPERSFTLSAEDIALLNPNTRTCPIFRLRRDADLTKTIYNRVPTLIQEAHGDRPEQNLWGLTIRRIFNMGIPEIVNLCVEAPYVEDHTQWIPMIEAKMVFQFDHRFGTYEGQTQAQANQGKLPEVDIVQHENPHYRPQSRFFIKAAAVQDALLDLTVSDWLICWRDITSSVTTRTAIAAVIPKAGTDFTLRIGFVADLPARVMALFLGAFNAFVFDYCTRQMIGGNHLSDYIVKQLPIPSSSHATKAALWDEKLIFGDWILPRVLEMTYTAWDLESFALDCGWDGPPFRWDEDRRFLLRCELDSAFFHLYLPATPDGQWKPACIAEGAVRDDTSEELSELKHYFPTPRDAVSYIMDTFPIVRRKDEAKYEGDYRTKRIILEIYDEMAEAMRTGQPYQTRLDPSPADPRYCHPPKQIQQREG